MLNCQIADDLTALVTARAYKNKRLILQFVTVATDFNKQELGFIIIPNYMIKTVNEKQSNR